MFNEHGDYVPPDVLTRHIIVVTEPHVVFRTVDNYPAFRLSGQVLAEYQLGQTQIPTIGPRPPIRGGKSVAVLIEHETAQVGEILPPHEIEAGIETAAKKQAAVKASIEARLKEVQK